MRIQLLLCLLSLCGCEAALADLYGSFSTATPDYCDDGTDPRCSQRTSEDGQPWACDVLLRRCLPHNSCIDEVRSCQSAALPVCVQGRCMPCAVEPTLGDAECAARAVQRRDTRERCVAGACVECRENGNCPAEQPVCRAQSCTSCRAHDECESGVCRLDSSFWESAAARTGTCVDSSAVAYVHADVAASGTGDRASPFATTGDALQAQRPFLYLLPAVKTYGAVDISDRSVVVIGGSDGGSVPRIAALRVQTGKLTASRIALAPDVGQVGAVCRQQGTLVLRHVEVTGPSGPARGVVASTGCTHLEVTASRISQIQGTGIAVQASEGTYRIVNSAIRYCGSTNPRYGSAAVVLSSGSRGTFAFNTLYQNLDAVECGSGQQLDNFIAVSGAINGCSVDRSGDLGADLDPVRLDLADTPRNRACCIDQASTDPSVADDFLGLPRPSGASPDRGYLERPAD